VVPNTGRKATVKVYKPGIAASLMLFVVDAMMPIMATAVMEVAPKVYRDPIAFSAFGFSGIALACAVAFLITSIEP
jgi:hypothetical protein